MSQLPWKAWYKTARWRALRLSIFARDRHRCAQCKRVEADTAKLVCDHIKPHRGDERLFWDQMNLQTLCDGCHNGAKQAKEQESLHTRGVWY